MADNAPRSVAGRVVTPGAGPVRPVANLWVLLHRVGTDTAAPLDSMRSRVDGTFSFNYRATGRADAIYFVSALYAGIAYFSAPLRGARVSGADAEITVYDTTSRAILVHVRGRHIVVSSPRETGAREVVEVYEVSNDTSVTLISPDGAKPTWSVGLPRGAADFRIGQADIAPDALHASGGRVLIVAPLAPGLKQISFAYRLPSSSFPVSIPLERPTDVLEVLVEEPAAKVDGAKLAAGTPVAVEGRSFQRYLAQDVGGNAVARIDVPAVTSSSRRAVYLAAMALALGATMLMALAASFTRRRGRPVSVAEAFERPSAADDPDIIARVIADLDTAFERTAEPTDTQRATYQRRRGQLKARLADALAARGHRA